MFELLDAMRFTLVGAVTGQSFLSSYTRAVSLIRPPSSGHTYSDYQVAGDFASSLRTELSRVGDQVDLILVDLVHELDGVLVLPDGSVITRSRAYIEAGGERNRPSGSWNVDFGSSKHREYWQPASIAVGTLLARLAPDAKVALLEIPLGESIVSMPVRDNGVKDLASVYEDYLTRAASALGAELISVATPPTKGVAPEDWRRNAAQRVSQVFSTTAELPPIESLPTNTGHPKPAGHTSAPQIDPSTLARHHWRMSRAAGTHVIEPMILRVDGKILGSAHPNETSWEITDRGLMFFDDKGRPSTLFESIALANGQLRLEGWFLKDQTKSIRHVLTATEYDWRERARRLAKNPGILATRALTMGWSVGRHASGDPTVISSRDGGLSIGSFCSFGEGVSIILDELFTRGVTAYRFIDNWREWPLAAARSKEPSSGRGVRIGNDVTIGQGAVILSGVSIGDGAIVHPQSLVADHVAPYSIVAGSPATVIGSRFSADQIESLLGVRWWDWEDERIDEFAHLLMGQDVDEFLRAARARIVRA